jgi:predicted RNase H-like HicB family nuclease
MFLIEAIIERAKDDTFSVYCVNEMFTGMGNTTEAAKMDMRQQMDFFKKTAIEDNFSYPAFLDGDFEIKYYLAISTGLCA